MAETLEELVLKLSADVSGLTAGFTAVAEESKKAADKTNAHLASLDKGLANIKSSVLALAGAIAGALGLNAIGSMIAKSMEAIDVQAKLADRLGITTDELAALKLAAELSGTSIDSVARSVTFLNRQLDSANRGSKESIEAFKQLGIEVSTFSKLSSSEQMGIIADKLYKIDDQARRTAIAVKLLGRGAMEMDAFLRDGSDGIRMAKEEVEKLGGAISRMDMNEVEEANDLWTSFQAIITRIWDELTVQLAPAFKVVLKEAIEFAQTTVARFGGVKQMITTLLMETLAFADGWVRTAQTIGGVISNLVTALDKEWKTMKSGFEVMSTAIRYAFAIVIDEIGNKVSVLAHSVADLMTEKGIKGANVFREMAGHVAASTGGMKASAETAFEGAKVAAVKAAEESKNAWRNIFTVDASGSKVIQDMMDAIVKNSIMGEDLRPGKAQEATEEENSEDPLEKYKEELKGKLIALDLHINEDLLKEEEFYIAQQDLLKSAKEQGLITEAEYALAIEELNIQHTERLNEIDAAGAAKNRAIWEAGWKGKAKILGDVLGSLSVLMQSKNREMFEVGKAAAYANTVVNTASAAMGAYNAYASIPYIGPVLGAAAAAAAVAAGAVQLSTISSTSFGGGGSAGGSFSAVSPSAGSPPGGLTQGGSQTGVTQTGSPPSDITINVQGKDGMTKEELINLSEELENLKRDGVTIGRLKFQ